MAQLIGRVRLDLGGRKVRIKKGASLDLGGPERSEVMDSEGGFHFTEEIKPSVLEFVMLHTSTDDANEIHALKGIRVSFIADNGVTYVADEMVSMTTPKISDDGECAFRFVGAPAQKQ